MANHIVSTKLPRAIAKEKDGIVMFWVEELGVAGLHIRGIAQLLECNPKTITQAVTCLTVTQIVLLEAEILTEQGIRTVTLITETDLPRVLRHIARSKAKAQTRDLADDIRDRLAAAGFKLAVMLELAPQQLKAQVDRHVEELEALKLKAEIAKQETLARLAEQKTMELRHYVVTVLPEPVQQKILGYKEIKTTEYIDRTIAPDGSINDGVGITYIQKRYGFKSTKEAWGWLEAIGMGKLADCWQHQLSAVHRSAMPREHLAQLDALFDANPRQKWLGE
jgi:hypothetical protein